MKIAIILLVVVSALGHRGSKISAKSAMPDLAKLTESHSDSGNAHVVEFELEDGSQYTWKCEVVKKVVEHQQRKSTGGKAPRKQLATKAARRSALLRAAAEAEVEVELDEESVEVVEPATVPRRTTARKQLATRAARSAPATSEADESELDETERTKNGVESNGDVAGNPRTVRKTTGGKAPRPKPKPRDPTTTRAARSAPAISEADEFQLDDVSKKVAELEGESEGDRAHTRVTRARTKQTARKTTGCGGAVQDDKSKKGAEPKGEVGEHPGPGATTKQTARKTTGG